MSAICLSMYLSIFLPICFCPSVRMFLYSSVCQSVQFDCSQFFAKCAALPGNYVHYISFISHFANIITIIGSITQSVNVANVQIV